MDITEFNRLTSTHEINRHPWELARARIARFLLSKYNVPCTAIADIGSGDVFVLKYLLDQFPHSSAIAVDNAYTPKIVETLKTGMHADRIQFFDSLEHALVRQRPSCILLMDVIEHIKDDRLFLKDLVKSTGNAPSPFLLITVPAFQALFSKHDQLLFHYRRYNRKSLTALCRENNLQIVTSGYFFFSLIPARIIQLIAEKLSIRKPTKAVDNWNGGHLASRIISSILWIDFRVCFGLSRINIKLPGLSCFCICQKSAS